MKNLKKGFIDFCYSIEERSLKLFFYEVMAEQELIKILTTLKKFSLKYAGNQKYITILADLFRGITTNDIIRISKLPFVQKLYSHLKENYNCLDTYKYYYKNKQIELSLNYFIQLLMEIDITLIYMINTDYDKFIKRFGGEERAIARLNSLLSNEFKDNCLYIKDIEKGSIKCTFVTSLINTFSILYSLKDNNTFNLLNLPGVDESLSIKEIERPMYAITYIRQGRHNYFIEYFQRGKFEDSRKKKFIEALKRKGIGNFAESIEIISYKEINYRGGYINAFINFMDEYFEDIIKWDYEKLSDALDLNENVKIMLKEAVEEVNHVNPFDWIVRYLEDNFALKGDIIQFKDVDFSKNEKKKISADKTYSRREYDVLFVKKEKNYDFKAIMSYLGIEESEEDGKLWFHGTSLSSCENIIVRGVEIRTKHNYGHDFGTGASFYVGEDLKRTFEFNKKRFKFSNENMLAIIVFRTGLLKDIDESDKGNGNGRFKVCFLHNDEKKWKEVVKYSLEINSRELDECYPEVNDADFVYGPVSKFVYNKSTNEYSNISPLNFNQLALKSRDATKLFNASIKGILVFSLD